MTVSIDNLVNPSETYLEYEIHAATGVCRETLGVWRRKGFAPRRLDLPGKLPRVAKSELAAWLMQRDMDRERAKKPHLRKPLKPFSWLPAEERAAELERLLTTSKQREAV